jgi:hypothetical protein
MAVTLRPAGSIEPEWWDEWNNSGGGGNLANDHLLQGVPAGTPYTPYTGPSYAPTSTVTSYGAPSAYSSGGLTAKTGMIGQAIGAGPSATKTLGGAAGGGLASLLEDPEAIGAYTRPTPFNVPMTPQALEAARRLQLSSMSGLQDVLAHPAQGQARIEAALYDRAKEEIDRAALAERQKATQDVFHRGVGLSTILNDRKADIDRETFDATARARREAILGAGAEARADEAARRAALGQAYETGTGQIQSDANIAFTNAKNEADANRFAVSTAGTNYTNRANREQQQNQFMAEVNSREDLEKRRHDLAREMQRNQLIATGIAGGIGGLAGIFGPSKSSGGS